MWLHKSDIRQKIKALFDLTLDNDLLVSSWSFKTEPISTTGSALSVMLLMEVFSIWYSFISSTRTLHCSCLLKQCLLSIM